MAPEMTKVHPLIVRIAHWINVLAVLIMITQRLEDLQRSIRSSTSAFPDEVTLGGWLAGALQWHFAAMWLFALNGIVYVTYGILSGHFRRKLLPISPLAVLRDVALRAARQARARRPDASTTPPSAPRTSRSSSC